MTQVTVRDDYGDTLYAYDTDTGEVEIYDSDALVDVTKAISRTLVELTGFVPPGVSYILGDDSRKLLSSLEERMEELAGELSTLEATVRAQDKRIRGGGGAPVEIERLEVGGLTFSMRSARIRDVVIRAPRPPFQDTQISAVRSIFVGRYRLWLSELRAAVRGGRIGCE